MSVSLMKSRGINSGNKQGENSMLTKNRLITVGLTVAVLAALYRIEPAKEALTGETKLLGVF